MATVTVFLSKKVNALLDQNEAAELVRMIGDKVEKLMKSKTYPNLSTSIVSGSEVSVNIFDVGNTTGLKADYLAWQVKVLVIAYVYLKKYLLTPNDVRVETSLRTVN